MRERTRVLYIGGWGRSGSTLLGCLLGQLPPFCAAGEVREVWQRGCLEDRLCGCGERFSTCAFWRQVGDEAFGGWEHVDFERFAQVGNRIERPKRILLLIGRGHLTRDKDVRAYVDALADLYGGIARASGRPIVVDSSKIPSHAFILRHVPNVDLAAVHLVRDSRGVAFSWQKRLVRPDGQNADFMRTYPPAKASLAWLFFNALTGSLGLLGTPYLRVRYEDLVSAPAVTLGQVLQLVGASGDLSFIGDGSARLDATHTVDGNPMRLMSGEIAIQADEDWRQLLSARDRRLVTAITAPLLSHYGYDVRAQLTP